MSGSDFDRLQKRRVEKVFAPKTEWRGPPPAQTRQGVGSLERARPGQEGVERAAWPVLRRPCRGDGPFHRGASPRHPPSCRQSTYTCAWVPTGRTLSFKASAGLRTSGLRPWCPRVPKIWAGLLAELIKGVQPLPSQASACWVARDLPCPEVCWGEGPK